MRDSQTSIIHIIARRPARALTCAALAVAFAATPVLSSVAYGVSTETQAELEEAETELESSAAAYTEAVAELEALQEQIDEIEVLIAEIEEELPELQERASQAMRESYKTRSSSNTLVSIIFSAQNLSDFISSCVYMDEIQAASTEAIDELTAKQQELEEAQAELAAAQAELEEEKAAAADALAAAQEARAAAQAQAEEEEAAELAALAAADEEEQTAAASGTGTDSENTANTATATGQTVSTSVASGGVDWSLSYDEFIAEWTSRIDAYLEGSPLAGYGSVFAEAAWTYGVDPRWSPAIACIESTKGTYCFRSYNAWGWLGQSFSSWEEAIPSHVAYLARVYGTTLTTAAAQKYCPPTWQDWYNKVAAQMNSI